MTGGVSIDICSFLGRLNNPDFESADLYKTVYNAIGPSLTEFFRFTDLLIAKLIDFSKDLLSKPNNKTNGFD